jgi:hypothetical protein
MLDQNSKLEYQLFKQKHGVPGMGSSAKWPASDHTIMYAHE